MKEVHITANSLIPIGAASACLGFIAAAAMWAANIEAKAEKAIYQNDTIKESQLKFEGQIQDRLQRIESKLDKVLEK